MIAVVVAGAGVAAQRQPPLPPPPVSLSVPHPIPPISTGPRPDLYQAPQTPPPPPVYNPGFYYGPSVFVPSGYGPFLPPPMMPIPPPPQGGLRLETSPGSAEVYVDGAYVGLVEDFGISGRALDIIVGRHRVELRAAGYATLAFDVNIAANQITRYRGDLQRLNQDAPQARVALTPKPTYVIPNCYAGDRPPTSPLPRGCSIAQMRVRQP